MNKLCISRIAFFVATVLLLSGAVTISRDYQDSWILEGLEIPYAVFVLTYISYFMLEKRFNWLILVALVSHITFLLIPNLKYTWYQGTAIDQHAKYSFALDTCTEGHVPTGYFYSETPFFLLSFTILSNVSGLPMLQSMKYFPLMLWFAYPIWVYIITRKICSNSSILKYALLFSSILMRPETSYIVTGTLFGAFFFFLTLVQFAKQAEHRERRDWVVAIIFILAISGGHSVSSIVLSATLFTVALLSLVFDRFSHDFRILTRANFSYLGMMTVIVISITWFSNLTTGIFNVSVDFFRFYFWRLLNVLVGPEPSGSFPIRFAAMRFIDQLRLLVVLYGTDLLVIFLITIASLVVIRNHSLRKKRGLALFSLCVFALEFFLLLGLVLNLGFHWPDRMLRYLFVVAPILSGVFLYQIEAKLNKKIVSMLIIGLLVALASLELYRCQPLIPPASSLGKGLPRDEPLIYINMVNTGYQRYMISHAERLIPNNVRVAVDKVTELQLVGLANLNFSKDRRIISSFLEAVNQTSIEFDYFLLHLPGIGGKFLEKPEYRTRDVILSIIYDSSYNIVYSNAESYILDRR